MKRLIFNLFSFSTIIIFLISFIFFLPPTPRSKKSLLFSQIDKDSLLINTPSPRIILVGGSNLSFGINSQTIKDSLNLNPINTGVHASIGLIYMLDHTLDYIKAGDVVVVIPEYSQFFDNFAYGGEELLRTIFDVPSLKKTNKLRFQQIVNILPFLFKYIFTKVKKEEYVIGIPNKYYSRNSFNKYGDVYKHWNMPNEKVIPYNSINLNDQIDKDVVRALLNYQDTLLKRGARMYVSFPSIQESSYKNCESSILLIEKVLRENSFKILGTSERYKFNDSLIFNTPYHLTKNGVDYRTELLIEDFKSYQKSPKNRYDKN